MADKATEGATTTATADTALAVAEAKPLSTEQKEAGEKLWREKIAFFKSEDNKAWTNVLMLHWQKGKFVGELLNAPQKYNNHVVKEFADAIGVSEPAVYSYLHFSRKKDEEQVKQLAEMKMSWRNISYLLSIEDDKVFDTFIKQIAAGKITSDELPKKVREYNMGVASKAKSKGKKTDGRKGNIQSLRSIKTTISLCVDMVTALDLIKTVIKEADKIADEKNKSDVKTAIRGLWRPLRDVSDKLEAVMKLKE